MQFGRRGVSIRIYWEPRDCWIGFYWTFTRGKCNTIDAPVLHWDEEWHLYICLLPCLPLHIQIPCNARTTAEYYADDY